MWGRVALHRDRKNGRAGARPYHRRIKMKKPRRFPTRKYPARGVLVVRHAPTIAFVTVCTRNRTPWLAERECHGALKMSWGKADAWLVGRYVIMPDHIHLFAAPGARDVEMERWVQFWKSLVTRTLGERAKGWQRRCWHHRLRRGESYEEKWAYVVDNPVRKGLVTTHEDWAFQGELEILSW